jgi:hypothetical protein
MSVPARLNAVLSREESMATRVQPPGIGAGIKVQNELASGEIRKPDCPTAAAAEK